MHSQDDRALRLLWGIDAPPARGPKARWTPRQVADVAVAVADEGGLAAVSLARVAERLGMTTTALYRYVDSKAALIELMVDAAIGDPPQIVGADWRERSRFWVEALAEHYYAHPWLTEVKPQRMPCQPRVYAWIDALVGAVGADVQVDPLRLALLLDSLIRTYTTLELNMGDMAPAAWLDDAVASRFPRLSAATRQDVTDTRRELEFAVDAVLTGVR